ncbi:hypothetical protein FRC17_002458 [Serendipita sp. 399]|nr:hypothetical protein FRC17_002458 [Serendipita sp. 399]
MTSGLIQPAEVDKLFKIFFDKLNVFVSILDPVLHTPATTFGRSSFLFTVVCAISSRYYVERPELYMIAMRYARRAAAESLIDAVKSVDLCQAYILMSVYSMPSNRWEDAREWLYLGLAIRMAIDLNLHIRTSTKIQSEQHERELLNRTRTWLICYNLDRSVSAQLGKPASIRPDPIIRSCLAIGNRPAWWNSSANNDPYDLHLCAYTELLSTIIAEFQERVYWDPKTETSGLRTDLDLVAIAFEYDKRLREWSTKTAVSFATHSSPSSSQCAYRVQLLPFYVNYLRLVVLSLGFQQVVQKRNGNHEGPRPEIVKRCLNAASSVLSTVVEDLAPTDYLRFAPDGHFVFSSFAAAFLIKMLRPEHAIFLEGDERTQIMDIVERLIDTFKSPRIAVDARHTPMLYSRFLASLITNYKEDGAGEIGDGATSVDSVGVPTPPMLKQDIHSPQGQVGVKSAGISAAMKRHRPSPSIEISPAPDPTSNGPPPPPQTIFDPDSMMENTLFPAMDEANATASTVHAASTVHGGSQYGGQVGPGQMLLPMYAINNDGFWNSMLPPGLTWPQEEWSMNLDTISEEYPHDAFDPHYQTEQLPQQYGYSS